MAKMEREGIEMWKPVEGYEGIYEVSNYGKVRSLDRYISNNWGNGLRKIKGRTLTPTRTGEKDETTGERVGYYYLRLCKNGTHDEFYVHCLVSKAFLPNPDNLPEVNHKDEDKTNNFVYINPDGTVDIEKSNLEWCTRVYNVNYGTARIRAIEKTGYKVECMSVDNWNERVVYISLSDAAAAIGCHRKTISRHISNHYPYRGFYWRFFD